MSFRVCARKILNLAIISHRNMKLVDLNHLFWFYSVNSGNVDTIYRQKIIHNIYKNQRVGYFVKTTNLTKSMMRAHARASVCVCVCSNGEFVLRIPFVLIEASPVNFMELFFDAYNNLSQSSVIDSVAFSPVCGFLW